MKIKSLTLVVALALLCATIIGTQFIDSSTANPVSSSAYKGETSAPSKPTITTSSPNNNTKIKINSLSINVNVSITTTNMQNYQEWIQRVYYKTDWLQEDTNIYEYYNPDPNYIRPKITEFHYRLNLTDIPEGAHKITFHTIESGFYCPSLLEYYGFSTNASSVAIFTIDTTPPRISVLSLEDMSTSSDVPLNFEVDELFEEASYVLDGQQNVTLAGNITLAGLPNGEHNIKFYVTDEAGNTGVSKTINFYIEVKEPVPITIVVASIVSVAIIVAGLTLYLKKRKR